MIAGDPTIISGIQHGRAFPLDGLVGLAGLRIAGLAILPIDRGKMGQGLNHLRIGGLAPMIGPGAGRQEDGDRESCRDASGS